MNLKIFYVSTIAMILSLSLSLSLSLECDRRKYFQGCFTSRILNTQRPWYFYQALSEQFMPLHRSERVQSSSIDIPIAWTETYKNAFLITPLEQWSKLLNDVINASSFYIFSNNFLKHLMAS